MTNTLQVDTKGLDQLGESTLTFSELKRHMDNTKTVALLDAAFTDIVAASPRLEIRRDGTYIALPERKRSEEHTSELQSLMRISYAVFCLKKKTKTQTKHSYQHNYHAHKYKRHN